MFFSSGFDDLTILPAPAYGIPAVSGQGYKRHLRYVQNIISNASKQYET